jgi:uncharacterized protein
LAGTPFRERYGPWAVIAGASEGIGAAFAHGVAKRGIHPILLARRPEPLKRLADELRRAYNVEVETAPLDLASETLADALQAAVGDREVGLCVYNAAFSLIRPFNQMSLEEKRRHIRVNCDGPMTLATLLGQQMVARGRGGIILMSSAASLKGTELLTMYAATKAFTTNLAEGLWQEYRQKGVDVLGVIAGATSTPNYEKTHPRVNRFTPPAQKPDDLAEKALQHLGLGYPIWHSTWQVGLAGVFLTRILPRSLAVRFFSRTTRGIYQHYRNI